MKKTVCVKWKRSTQPGCLIAGKSYKLLSVDDGFYRIKDETGNKNLYIPEAFELEGDISTVCHIQSEEAQNGYGPHPCPVCGQFVCSQSGSYDICPICRWEDDQLQGDLIGLSGGANGISLREYRDKFIDERHPEWMPSKDAFKRLRFSKSDDELNTQMENSVGQLVQIWDSEGAFWAGTIIEYIGRLDSERLGFSCIRVSLIDQGDMSFYEDEMMMLEWIGEEEEDEFPSAAQTESVDEKLRRAVGSYVRLICKNTDLGARYEGRIEEYPVSGKYGIASVRGQFLRVGLKLIFWYDVEDVIILEGTEADVLRGKITGETIQDYIFSLTDEQLVYLAAELKIDLEDLPFLAEDKIGDICEAIKVVSKEETAVAERENRTLSERGIMAADITTIIEEELEKKKA